MDCRETLHRHLLALPRITDESGVRFSSPTETSPGRFTMLCHLTGPQKSIFKVVCQTQESNSVAVQFLPLSRLNETGGYVPVPTNVKDIYSQYFQPLQVQSSYQNDRMMVG